MKVVCPICKTVLEEVEDDFPFRPFCSSRCKTIDLGNWLDEKYRIVEALTPEGADEEPTPN